VALLSTILRYSAGLNVLQGLLISVFGREIRQNSGLLINAPQMRQNRIKNLKILA